MTRCGDIENKLSAYLEGVLSASEKKLIEEHLVQCTHCNAVLSELKKTGDLLHGLEEVEPPPWFTQKVMARVREEGASKKGLFEKLFYPFHIKIPIEVMATCLVAILAFSVYRTSGPELKALHEPQASSTTVPQETAPKGTDVAPPAVPKTAPRLKTEPGVSTEKQKDRVMTVTPDTKVSSGLQYNAVPPPTAPQERDMVEKKQAIKGEQVEQEMKAGASMRKSDSQVMQERIPSPAPLSKGAGGFAPSQEGTLQRPSAAKKLRSAKEFQATAPMRQDRFSITLRVNNAETALRETETLLNRSSARNINIISRSDNLIMLVADLPGQKIKEFQEALKAIGNTKESGVLSPSPDAYIRLSIEITTSR